MPVAESVLAPPGPIPNPVVTQRSAGEYCGGDPTGGEAAAGTPHPLEESGVGQTARSRERDGHFLVVASLETKCGELACGSVACIRTDTMVIHLNTSLRVLAKFRVERTQAVLRGRLDALCCRLFYPGWNAGSAQEIPEMTSDSDAADKNDPLA